MYVTLQYGPLAGQERHVERNQTTQLLLDLGLIELAKPPAPPAPSTEPRFFSELSIYTGATLLSVVLPTGEKRSYSGFGNQKTAALILSVEAIPEDVWKAFEAKRSKG